MPKEFTLEELTGNVPDENQEFSLEELTAAPAEQYGPPTAEEFAKQQSENLPPVNWENEYSPERTAAVVNKLSGSTDARQARSALRIPEPVVPQNANEANSLLEYRTNRGENFNTVARGGIQGLSAGFGDEATGALMTAKEYMDYYRGAGGNPRGFLDSYRKYRDQARQENKQAREFNPKAYDASNAIGGTISSLAIPGGSGLVGNLTSSAGQGALMGVGQSEADLTKGDVAGVLNDAELGGALGFGSGVAASGISALGSKVGAPAMRWAGNKLRDAAEQRAIAATGSTGIQSLKYPEGTGRKLLDEGVVSFWAHPEDIAERALNLKQKTGKDIGELVEELGLQEQHSVTLGDLTQAIDNKISELKKLPGVNNKLIKGLASQKKLLQEHPFDVDTEYNWGKDPNQEGWETDPTIQRPNQPVVSFDKIHKTKGAYDDQINYNSSDYRSKPEYAMRDIYNEFENDIAKNLPPGVESEAEAGNQFLKNKDTYRKIAPVADFAERRAATLNQSPPLGLLDIATVAPGLGAATTRLMQGDLQGAAIGGLAAGAGAIGRRVIAPRINSMRAVTANNIGSLLQSAPQVFGKYAKPLMAALQRGGSSLGATHFALYNRDPQYRELYDKLNDPNQIEKK